MRSEDGRFALSYNGECYNFQALRGELEADGESFRSTGDTEVVLKLLARHGSGALCRINGMFALALWDEARRHLLLARDRFGQKPLYYAQVGDLWLFASEVRALLASGLIERRLDPAVVRGYLALGAVQGPPTAVAGVRLVPAASFLEIEAGRAVERGRYWSPDAGRQARSDREVREVFQAAVRRHLVSDAPIGLFLSGGVDSSAVAAAAVRVQAARPVTLSVVFPEQPGESEGEHALRMAQYAGTEHREIPITGREMAQLLPRALDAMDQPTTDSINTWLVSHAARQAGMKVALTGLGGDELFGGYPAFCDVPRLLSWRRTLGQVAVLLDRLLTAVAADSRRFAKLADLCGVPPRVLDLYVVRRRLFSRGQVRALAPDLGSAGTEDGLEAETRAELERLVADRPVVDAVGLLELAIYMGQTLLRDSDVMGMAHGLEIRVPFLDAEFAGLALGLDAAVRSPQAIPKAYFVRVMGDWLPAANTDRPKRGFMLPFAHWLTHELRDEVEAGLQTLTQGTELFAAGSVQALWQRFLARPEAVGWARPWALFVLGRFLRQHRLQV
jgi:asparagine synthase (glutamine-hydrolysing)